MTAYLRANPPARSQFRSPRRQRPSGVIVAHSAENTPDTVGADGGAENVARFIQGRNTPGSYHDLCDSDSTVHLVDWADEAFHDGTGTNPHSLSISAATRADLWPRMAEAWRNGCIEQMARAASRQAKWVKATTGITVPARRITADQARARVPGFVTHAELDPSRRSDPGAGFPWPQFLERFAQLTSQTATPELPEDPMAYQLDIADYVDRCYKEADRRGDIKGKNYWALTAADSDDPRAVLDYMRSALNLPPVS